MKRAIAYLRVSTSGQEQGHGLQEQKARIKDFAKELGYDVKKTFREVHTGMGPNSIRDREELQKAIKYARAKRWPIFVSTFDRLSRDEKTVADLLKIPGLEVFSTELGIVDASAAAMRVKARAAERTGKVISTSTKEALSCLKRDGKRLGNPTNLSEAQKLGAASTKRKFDLMVEEYVPLIAEIVADGAKSRKQIAAALNKWGMTTSRGKPWTEGNIRRLLNASQPKLDQMKKYREVQKGKIRSDEDPLWGRFG